jgi:V8-like Glu-specific endopeptidase
LHENNDETPLPPAPVPYLRLAIRTRRGPSSEGGNAEGDADEEDDEGGNNGDEIEVDEGRERIVGTDERIQIKPATLQPYGWICYLDIRSGNSRYSGSGFLVNIPGSNTGCILTAGYNLWIDTRTYAESLEVTFPGKDPIHITEPTNTTNRQ